MGDRRQPTFHGFVDGALEALPAWDDLSWVQQMLLVDLLRMARWDKGTYRTTLVLLGERTHLRPATVAEHLDVLEREGLVHCHFPRGHDGTIVLRCYEQVMHTTAEQDDMLRTSYKAFLRTLDQARRRAERRKAG